MKTGKFIKLDLNGNMLFLCDDKLYVGSSYFFTLDIETGQLYTAVWGQWHGRPDAYFFVPCEPTWSGTTPYVVLKGKGGTEHYLRAGVNRFTLPEGTEPASLLEKVKALWGTAPDLSDSGEQREYYTRDGENHVRQHLSVCRPEKVSRAMDMWWGGDKKELYSVDFWMESEEGETFRIVEDVKESRTSYGWGEGYHSEAVGSNPTTVTYAILEDGRKVEISK